MSIKCNKCGSEHVVKAGKIKGNQRYKCMDCGRQFQPNRHKGKPKSTKRLAILLYMLGLSMRTISRVVKTDVHAVYRWIRDFAEKNYEKPAPQGSEVVVELDEMWHFLNSKKTSFGYGKLIVAIPVNPAARASSRRRRRPALSTGSADRGIMIHLQNFTNG